MEITAISQEEFEEAYGRTARCGTLNVVLNSLEVGAAFRTPCTWTHNNKNRPIKKKDGTERRAACYGSSYAHQVVKKEGKGKRILTVCRDKELFVIMVE